MTVIRVVLAGICLGAAGLACPGVAASLHGTGTVNGLAADIWTWADSTGHIRTVALKKEGSGNAGHGGYAIQMTYYRNYPAGSTTWLPVTVNAAATGDGGFGYFVSHERYRFFGYDKYGNPVQNTIAGYIFGKDDSPLGNGFAATSALPLDTATAGAQSFTIQYGHYGTITPTAIDPNTGYDKPALVKNAALYAYYTTPVTTTWVFQQGRDYPRIDISLDLSKVIAPGTTKPAAGLISFDVRGPYGAMVFDNGADGAINTAIWGDQQFLFAPVPPAATPYAPTTRSSAWTWNAVNGGARYNGLTAGLGATGQYEMGLFEPAPVSASALADGYATERSFTSTSYAAAVARHTQYPSVDSCPGGQVQTLPSDGSWPYQSLQYSLPCPAQTSAFLTTPGTFKKLAWGSSSFYGTTLGWVWNGVQSYPINAFPASYKLKYSTCLVLGWDSPTPIVVGSLQYSTRTAANAAMYTKTSPIPAGSDCATIQL